MADDLRQQLNDAVFANSGAINIGQQEADAAKLRLAQDATCPTETQGHIYQVPFNDEQTTSNFFKTIVRTGALPLFTARNFELGVSVSGSSESTPTDRNVHPHILEQNHAGLYAKIKF